MPRLNHGTLLENIVVLEATRVITAEVAATVEFACSFAMSPLTQCWHKTKYEPGNNPKFNAGVMSDLLNGTLAAGATTSYSAMLRDCLANAPNLPIVPYAGLDATQLCEYGGPNGALLAAMLLLRQGKSIRVWSNDLADNTSRYRGSPTSSVATECPRTTEYASALSPNHGTVPLPDAFCGRGFPDSVPDMASWCGACAVRIGFLDPDSYTPTGHAEPGQVDSSGHTRWLKDLYPKAACTAGIMFFASRDALGRPTLIRAFHDDALGEYPRSVVFRHGIHMVGVKLRGVGNDALLPRVVAAVQDAWVSWSALTGRGADGLSCYLDGQG